MSLLHRSRLRPTRRDAIVAVASAVFVLLFRQSTTIYVHHPETDLSLWPGQAHIEHEVLGNDFIENPMADGRKPHQVSSPKDSNIIMPSTKVIAHAAGWTMFENLYMHNGTLFIISEEDASTFPEIRMMTSTGMPAENTPENIAAREPTSQHMEVLNTLEGNVKFGERIYTIDKLSLLYNDPPQFIDHYYHFAAELLLGTWRFYAGHLDPYIDVRGKTSLPMPTRAIFAHCKATAWRDYSGFNQFFLHAAFPSISLETQEDWEGRVNMTHGRQGENGPEYEGLSDPDDTAKAWRFDRVILADRSAAFRGEAVGGRNQRTASSAYESNQDIASRYWWETVRRNVLRFSGVPEVTMDAGLPYEPAATRQNIQPPPIVITYVSRQGWRRRLIEEDHLVLVQSLTDLCQSRGWEFLVFHPENYTRDEQLQISARSTVMLGVHGNGLTHLIAMPSTPISAVIEIFYPEGWARDYQWTAHALGHRHFAVWNDTWISDTPGKKLPYPSYPDGFQGTQIPVYGPLVAQLVADRVEGRLPNVVGYSA